ncbi:YafY family protein [Homoserinimonas sp. OAct 916]|uniref:helix-turn-helix transcriptional regulator n=1 Tax=Homoserinimonas sp. OAct 916 TaxID=2211450 RepID=UPI000DBE7633|nr:WYL domain-containing protein [Homoserinimonas sp. OAct 916]
MADKPGQLLRASDKLTYLLTLVPYLIAQNRVSVTDAAEHFQVEPQQIRDWVKLIAISGIPGDTGQYLPDDLFDIVWDDFENNDQIVLTHRVAIEYTPKFSGKEAAALIAGLQYLSALPEQSDREAVASLMAKLTRGTSQTPSEVAVADTVHERDVPLIGDAVKRGLQIEFDYLSARGEHERRIVDPLRIDSTDNSWYLRAWCHLRESVRTFRLDRMSDVQLRDAPITRHAGEVVLPETLFDGSDEDVNVLLELPSTALSLIADFAPEPVGEADADGLVHVTIRAAGFHGLKRLVAGLSGVVRVVAPDEARTVVAEWASAGAAAYEGV